MESWEWKQNIHNGNLPAHEQQLGIQMPVPAWSLSAQRRPPVRDIFPTQPLQGRFQGSPAHPPPFGRRPSRSTSGFPAAPPGADVTARGPRKWS